MVTPTATDEADSWRAIADAVTDIEIVSLERRLAAAKLAADVDALAELIDDDLLFTGPDGRVTAKAEDLAAHASGVVRFRTHVPKELRVRRLTVDTAIVALRTQLCVEVRGTPVEGEFVYTRVWHRSPGGAWRITGGHVSAVPS